MVDEVQEAAVNVNDVMTVEKFVPMPPIAEMDLPLCVIKDAETGKTVPNVKAQKEFLLAVNSVRTGAHKVQVKVKYAIQVGQGDPRVAGRDYVEIKEIPSNLHIGALTTARNGQKGPFFIRVADILRSTGLKIGWTSMWPSGIIDFEILVMDPGPLFTQRGA